MRLVIRERDFDFLPGRSAARELHVPEWVDGRSLWLNSRPK